MAYGGVFIKWRREKALGVEQTELSPQDANMPGKFHNSGGEIIIAAAHLQASGHHQEPEAVGYRAALVRFLGWTLHLITVYLDCSFGIDEGPNATRTQAVTNLIRCT